jgi:hypothetical protein
MPDPGALRRVFELWCQRNTRTESAPLRRLVTGHASFSLRRVILVSTLGSESRSQPSKANRPLKAPRWPHLRRGFSLVPALGPRAGESLRLVLCRVWERPSAVALDCDRCMQVADMA